MALGQSHTVAESTDRSNKTTTSRIRRIFFLLFTVHFIIHFFVFSNTYKCSVPSRDLTRKRASKFDATRAHTFTTVYFVYFERVYLLEGREANPNVHATPTPTRDRGIGGKKETLFLSRPPRIYIYIYVYFLYIYIYIIYSRLLSLVVTKRRGMRMREKRVARNRQSVRRPDDTHGPRTRTVWTGRCLDRSAKRERRERNREDRERGGALWTTL